MSIFAIIMIIASVALTTAAQILMKSGMVSEDVRLALNSGELQSIIFAVITSPAVCTGLICFAFSVVIWLKVLSEVPLSTAYPFVSLGIAFTVAAGFILFGEPFSIQKIVGVVLILAGIFILAIA